MIAIISGGLAAGVVHVVSGPDHLAAVAPLSMTRQKRSWMIGAQWGIGHASGVILVAIIAYILREFFSVHSISWLSSYAERLVGVVLVVIGFWGIRRALTNRVHTHEHSHEGESHLHIHLHPAQAAHSVENPKPHFHTHTAFAVGTLHGLAGSSHFLGVIPALMFATKAESITYLAAFGVGTILSMAGFSSFMDLIARRSSHRSAQVYRFVVASFSVVAIAIGCFWLFKPLDPEQLIPQKTAVFLAPQNLVAADVKRSLHPS